MAITKTKKLSVKSAESTSISHKKNIVQSRLNVRLTTAIKERVAKAAALSGQDLTEFAVAVLSEKASLIIQQHDNLLLGSEDHDFFLETLNAPNVSEPSARSLSAAEKYRRGNRKGVRYILAD